MITRKDFRGVPEVILRTKRRRGFLNKLSVGNTVIRAPFSISVGGQEFRFVGFKLTSSDADAVARQYLGRTTIIREGRGGGYAIYVEIKQ